MAESPASLRDQQFAFARHLREPLAVAAPEGMEARRLGVYRELLHTNIRSLLSGNFPVIRTTLGDDAWSTLVETFFASHRSRTPLFTEIGREFVAFLDQHPAAADAPWLAELAHYEWVELALQISDADLPASIDREGDLLAGRPVVSPLAWALSYQWPVHRIGPGYRPTRPPDAPTLLLVRRDQQGDVHFAQVSPLAFRLLQLLSANETGSGRDVLQALAGEAAAIDPVAFLDEGALMLQRLHAQGVLLGTRRD